MDKKKTNILLGIAVVVIYGGSAYRVASSLDSDEEIPVVSAPPHKKVADDYAVTKDTTALRLNYRDPFGQAAATAVADTAVKRRVVNKPVMMRPTQVSMDFVKYAGYIANPGSKRTLVMLMINGKAAMLAEGESSDGIRLIKNMRDSVKVLYRNQVRHIVK